jgi:hypothetical protein
MIVPDIGLSGAMSYDEGVDDTSIYARLGGDGYEQGPKMGDTILQKRTNVLL